MAQGFGDSLFEWLGRLGRGFGGACATVWRVAVEDSLAEIRGYRNRLLGYWRERREQREQLELAREFDPYVPRPWGRRLRGLLGMPLFALQFLLLAVISAPLLIVQSLLYSLVGLCRFAVWLPMLAWTWFMARKRWEKAVGVLILAAATGAGGYLVHKLRNRIRGDVWAQYKEWIRKGDVEAARAELQTLKQRQPDDPLVDQRIAAWESGEGREDDPEIVLQLMFDHYFNGRLEAAAREAGKFVRRYPSHWHARLVLALEALTRKAAPEAAVHLAGMSRIREAGVNARWARIAAEACARAGEAATDRGKTSWSRGRPRSGFAGPPPPRRKSPAPSWRSSASCRSTTSPQSANSAAAP